VRAGHDRHTAQLLPDLGQRVKKKSKQSRWRLKPQLYLVEKLSRKEQVAREPQSWECIVQANIGVEHVT
jgi:hypothetical protein